MSGEYPGAWCFRPPLRTIRIVAKAAVKPRSPIFHWLDFIKELIMLHSKDNPGEKFHPSDFRDAEFITANRPFYERYVDTRAHGYDLRTSFKHAFGGSIDAEDDTDVHYAAVAVEASMKQEIQDRKKKISIQELWNVKRAAHSLAEIANDKSVSPKVRLSAIRELNRIIAAASRKEGANGKE